MKVIFVPLIFLLIANGLIAQGIGIGTTTPNPKAALEINSTNKGILIPSMTSSQRIAIPTPPNGLMVYDTDKNEFYHYNGTGWRAILNAGYWSRPITARDRIANTTDSIGIGTNSPTAKLHVNGDIKITDGSQGDGKVLTSDANGLASWQNAPFATTDRILVRFEGIQSDSLIGTPTVVYDNGSGLSFNSLTKEFTIFKSGLYHFEGTLSATTSDFDDPFKLRAGARIDGLYYDLARIYLPINEYGFFEIYILRYSFDMHLEFGTRVKFIFESNSIFSSGYISAYLISQ